MLKTDTAARVLTATATGKTYEMGELARWLHLPTALVRETVEQLTKAAYVEVRLAGAQYGSRAGYQHHGLTAAGRYVVASPNLTPSEPRSVPGRTRDAQRIAETRASDVLAAMRPGLGHQASALASTRGLPMHRVVTILKILIRDAHVVNVNQRNAQGKIGPHYYVTGTQSRGGQDETGGRASPEKPLGSSTGVRCRICTYAEHAAHLERGEPRQEPIGPTSPEADASRSA
ncbi:hypothetical protein WT83_16610 [Burkholderia territorii]|uniref:Uncharacterized protein n=1 Tax=Burkholderia territorii TaxID=1503055 RepID=A0A108ENJ0_9BURK|nr:hypothetical protein [Burkholderia territorii]KWN14710.1 hypothetical protein WT83_16610 [Burkholderia territorii]